MTQTAALTTTGLVPYTIGSTLTFELVPWLDHLPWDLSGGSAALRLADPNGNTFTITATILGALVQANWTVVGPVGTWTRAWDCTDILGVHLIAPPEPFTVATSPV